MSDMNPSLVPFESFADFSGLSILHCSVMPTLLLTELGQPVVQRYYEIASRDPKVIGFVAQTPEEPFMLGWVVGSPYPIEVVSRLRKSFFWFAGQMIRVAVTRPRTFFEVLRNAISPAEENIIKPAEIELTYLGVADEARGKGLGPLLLQHFLFAADANGYTRVTLSVEADNEGAIRMYRSMGFNIIKTFQEGKFHRHRMLLALNESSAWKESLS